MPYCRLKPQSVYRRVYRRWRHMTWILRKDFFNSDHLRPPSWISQFKQISRTVKLNSKYVIEENKYRSSKQSILGGKWINTNFNNRCKTVSLCYPPADCSTAFQRSFHDDAFLVHVMHAASRIVKMKETGISLWRQAVTWYVDHHGSGQAWKQKSKLGS